jgi:hypothetical protein
MQKEDSFGARGTWGSGISSEGTIAGAMMAARARTCE